MRLSLSALVALALCAGALGNDSPVAQRVASATEDAAPQKTTGDSTKVNLRSFARPTLESK